MFQKTWRLIYFLISLGHLNEYLALSIALSCMHLHKSTTSPESGKEMIKILTKLTNPYLKALFSFLIDSEQFDHQIVNNASNQFKWLILNK